MKSMAESLTDVSGLFGRIKAICISSERGTVKEEIGSARLIADLGIEGDAHAGSWHRQVSLLSAFSIDEFNSRGAGVKNGEFGENLVVCGIDLSSLPVGSTLRIGDFDDAPMLCITQRGKECHSHCRIYERMGDCIMPREGVFAKVIRGGEIKAGDTVRVSLPDVSRPFQAAVIVLSDKGAAGEREDVSGPEAVRILKEMDMR